MALNNVLDFARKNNKFYRERNQNLSFSELNKIPLLLKRYSRQKDLIKCVSNEKIGQLHLTSGTTGKPTYIAYTLADQYIYDLYRSIMNSFRLRLEI